MNVRLSKNITKGTMPKSSDRRVRSLAVSAAIMLFASGLAVELARAQGGASPVPGSPGGGDSAATWITAICTVVLAVVAIFQETIRGRFYRPKFKVSVETKPPDCVMVPITRKGNGSIVAYAVYLRLWVENTGNATGRKVEVYAKLLHHQRSDERWEVVPEFPPMNLKWANLDKVFFPSIPPGMGKHCDVAHVTDPSKRNQLGEDAPQSSTSQQEETLLVFDLMVAPNHRGHIVERGKYKLDILVAADNVRPISQTLFISLPRTWYSDGEKMLREGVGIRVLDDPCSSAAKR